MHSRVVSYIFLTFHCNIYLVGRIVRYLPGWLPGAGFQAYARKCREMIKELLDVPFETVKKNMVGCSLVRRITSGLISPF